MSAPSHTETEVEKDLRIKCEALDKEKSGVITVEELRKILCSFEDISMNDLKEMIEESQSGVGEEKVKYLELIKAMYADADVDEE